MIKKEGNKYCVYSHDGSRKFGCYTSEEKAKERLRQIEYFKHAKSGEGKMVSVKDCPTCCKNIPCDEHKSVPGVDKHKTISEDFKKTLFTLIARSRAEVSVKSPPSNKPTINGLGITIPTLNGSVDHKAVYAAVANLTPEQNKVFASGLIDQLEKQQENINAALVLAKKLMENGLTSEEFTKLSSYTQYDVLVQLLS